MRQLSFSGLEAQRHRIGPLTAHFLYLSTANCLNGITSSISRIQRSMPSNDQPLVISYTSRIPCRVKVTHNHTYKQWHNWCANCSTSSHLCSTRVRPKDGAESALPWCVPVEDTRTHTSWPTFCDAHHCIADLMLHNYMATMLTITLASLFSRPVELWSSCNQSLRSHTRRTSR